MRTTVDLPDELLDQLRSIARDTGRSLSAVVVDLMERGMQRRPGATIVKGRSGFPRFAAVGRPITTEDVRALEDEI
jgi:predicted transcriptional regulator